jgi:hypothetical protein
MKKLVVFISLHLVIFSFMVVSCGKNEVRDANGAKIVESRVNDCVVKGFSLTSGKRQRFITALQKPDGSLIELKTMAITFNVGDTVDIDLIGSKIMPVSDSLNVTDIL